MNQVLRKGARKGSKTTMMNVETNDTAAAVAEQGATVAPQKAALKKAASRKKGAPQGQKRAKGTPPNKPAKKAQKSARQQAPHHRQGREDPGVDRQGEGRDPGRDQECHRVASPQRARLHLHRWQQARYPDRVRQE